ncbi:Arsenate reductase [Andreprevotia sp. IGB-42]|uniref:arsenate reductase (glutaredoxin) n=1 Tax=Andreprevotia sp. IGB-42 TaxID=2497473 RepID=UPI0013592D25|nr:arsenate reductase (glutaredoxin) [Andreprevotia sp. IGB-42]KAF0814860.1 Arsenate reductase [Andreprevotia sp. IGB-42]
MQVTIYHNPRCSKSRDTLALLEARGIAPRVIEYLKTPPDAATLDKLLTLLKLQPRELMRRKEAEYSLLGLDKPELTRNELIAAMLATPRLIERPIVVVDDQRAVIGRPPEAILSLFV